MPRRIALLAVLGWILLLAIRVEGQEFDCGAAPCVSCCEAPSCARGWASGGYLLMWISDQPLPPLLTTGPIDVLGPSGRPGVLGQPGTQLLIGDSIGLGPLSGGQLTMGRWLGDGAWGAEIGGFFLFQQSAEQSASSPGTPGSPALAIPYLNAQTGQEDSTGVAFAGGQFPFSGAAILTVASELWGLEVNAVRPLAGRALELLAGFRFLSVDESLRFTTSSTGVGPIQDIFITDDRFQCDNDFYGFQLGIRGQVERDIWFVQGAAKLALGWTHQVTTIEGSLLTNDFNPVFGVGPPATFPGGYLALPTNIGRYEEDHFAVLPELSIRVGCRLTDRLSASVGYTALYLSSVARPGDQIDRVINPSQGPGYTGVPDQTLVGPARPAFLDRSSDLWVHGLSFLAEFRY